MRLIALAFAALAPLAAAAQTPAATIQSVVAGHILPGFDALAARSADLDAAAQADCDGPSLRAAWGAAFDAWVSVSHLRFGPTETDNRAFALAFWPDARGATPRTLAALIAARDPVIDAPGGMADLSIAARGFYAMEFVLFDDRISAMGDADYRCALVRAEAADIAATAAAIAADWQGRYAGILLTAGANDAYRTEAEALQELYKALSTGLEFTADVRLGRPLGTFDQPRPMRAEAWRSARSLRHVALSLAALRDLAGRLADGRPAVTAALMAAFDDAEADADLDDPAFAGVADPAARLRLEVLKQSIDRIRDVAAADLGPALGVAAGFNALDGD